MISESSEKGQEIVMEKLLPGKQIQFFGETIHVICLCSMVAILSLILLIIPLNAFCQQDWKLTKNKNGIKVYTKNSAYSNLKAIKTECISHGSLDRVIQIFQNIENQPQWVYSVKKSYLIRKFDDNTYLYYAESSLPWPAKDRYLIARMKITKDEGNDGADITISADRTTRIERSKQIRINYFTDEWKIRTLKDQKLSISHIVDIDPGGTLPAPIVNLFITTGPYQTILQLSQLLKE